MLDETATERVHMSVGGGWYHSAIYDVSGLDFSVEWKQTRSSICFIKRKLRRDRALHEAFSINFDDIVWRLVWGISGKEETENQCRTCCKVCNGQIVVVSGDCGRLG